jgi:hypothetical protein
VGEYQALTFERSNESPANSIAAALAAMRLCWSAIACGLIRPLHARFTLLLDEVIELRKKV